MSGNTWNVVLRIVACVAALALLTARPATADVPAWKQCTQTEPVFGLFWIGEGPGDRMAHHLDVGPAYFDPARPTLIFVHGFQHYNPFESPFEGGTWDVRPAPAPQADVDEAKQFYMQWLKAGEEGTNVALFDWKIFAQGNVFVDSDVRAAEAKIWESSPDGLAWFRCACLGDWCRLVEADGLADVTSVAEAFADAYRQVVAAYGHRPATIEVVAHSMGTQVAVKALDQLSSEGARMPEAVVLLDPGFKSPQYAQRFSRSITGDWQIVWDGDMYRATRVQGLHERTDLSVYKVIRPRSDWWQREYRKISRNLVFDYWLQRDATPELIAHTKVVDWYFDHLRSPIGFCAPGLKVLWREKVWDYDRSAGCWNECEVDGGRPEGCSMGASVRPWSWPIYSVHQREWKHSANLIPKLRPPKLAVSLSD